MGSTPQWCETAIRSANGGFFTDFSVSSLKRGDRESRTNDGSRRVSTAKRNGALRTQERLDASLASSPWISSSGPQSQMPGDAGMAGGGS
jgi:hypothetical protein